MTIRQRLLHKVAVDNRYHGRKRELLLLLASATKNSDGDAIVSNDQLAERLDCSPRHVRRLRAELRAEGAFEVVAPGGGRLRGGRGRAPRYRIAPLDSRPPGRPPVRPPTRPYGYPDIPVRPYSLSSIDKSVVGSTRGAEGPRREVLHSEKRWCDHCQSRSGWLYRDDGLVDPCPACR